MSNFEYNADAVIKRAQAAMDAGDYINASELLDTAIADATASLKRKPPAPPAVIATRNDPEDNIDNATGEANLGDELDDDDEADDAKKSLSDIERRLDNIVEKLGGGGSAPVKYPAASVLADYHENLQPPEATRLPGQASRAVSVAPATGTPSPSAFDVLVRQIAAERGVSKAGALARARLEHPAEFEAWQAAATASSTVDQQSLRARDRVEKAKPSAFEEACEIELAKGASTREVAAQRTINKFGTTLPHKLAKHRDDTAAEFRKRADELLDEFGSLPRCEALRKCRLEHPEIFARLQASGTF